uniref:Solute carrier family 66 member 3 n=1 Tax=Craspedostauros australis TaxID=1486917 RepID=A0A7R9WVS7_9STRA
MVELEAIPMVMPLAQWIWGADPTEEVNPKVCLSTIPFLAAGCFSQLIAKALGVAIILGSCLNKTPIMINVLNSKSAAGLSRNSLYGEVIVYANGAFYGFLEGHPFTAYGENGALLLQNIAIISLAWHFSKVGLQEQILSVVTFAIYSFITLFVMPDEYRSVLITSMWPVLLYARGSQILETFRDKQTGNLSIVTTGLNLVGSLVRIATTLQETGDFTVMMSFVLSLALNFIMFVQYWMYLENTQKIAAEASDKKTE